MLSLFLIKANPALAEIRIKPKVMKKNDVLVYLFGILFFILGIALWMLCSIYQY